MAIFSDASVSDRAAVVGLVGLGVFYVAQEYRETCPPISELRAAPGDSNTMQHLLDGEAHVAITVAAFALAAAWVSHDWKPSALIVGTFLALCYYNHSVLTAPVVSRPYGKD